MKNVITQCMLFIFLLYAKTLMAQKGEPVVISVTYKFSHINNLNNPNKSYQQEMILRLGKSSSRYSNWTREVDYKDFNRKQKSIAPTNGVMKVAMGEPMANMSVNGVVDFELLQYSKESKLVRTVTLGMTDYTMELKLPKINWKVYDDKREIGIYICQKATGVYAGRSYIAWFAPELPFQNGPWKLSGLPGLILEAYDVKNEVSFLFAELNKGGVGENTGSKGFRMVKVTENAFERAKKAYENDPTSVYKSQMPIGNDQKVNLSYTDEAGKTIYGQEAKILFEKNKKEIKHNPIELVKN